MDFVKPLAKFLELPTGLVHLGLTSADFPISVGFALAVKNLQIARQFQEGSLLRTPPGARRGNQVIDFRAYQRLQNRTCHRPAFSKSWCSLFNLRFRFIDRADLRRSVISLSSLSIW